MGKPRKHSEKGPHRDKAKNARPKSKEAVRQWDDPVMMNGIREDDEPEVGEDPQENLRRTFFA